MNDESKTKAQLLQELQGARDRIATLEAEQLRPRESALRIEQDNLRNIFEAMVDGVYVVNQQHDIQYANPVIVREFGETEGRKCHVYFHDLPQPCSWCKNADVFAGKTVRWDCTSRRNNRTYELIDTPLLNVDGSISKLEIFRDITDRQKAEVERMEQALDGADLGTWDWNVRTGLVTVNERFAEIIGQTVGELDPQFSTWIELIHPDDIREAEQGLAAHLEGKTQSYEIEHRVRHKSGEWIWVLGKGRVIARDSDGEPLRFCGTSLDISERKRAEAERERLMSAIEQVAETVVITDIDGTIQYVNPAFERITGYGRDEAVGLNPRILKSGKLEDALYKEMWRVLVGGDVWRGRLINRRKDGSLYTEEATISPVFDSLGETVNYVAVKRDITQELALEAQLHHSQKMEAIGRLAGGVAHDFNNVICAITGVASLAMDDLAAGDPIRQSLDEITVAAERAAELTQQLLIFSRKQIVEPKVFNLSHLIENLHSMLVRLISEDIILRTVPQAGLGPIRADPGQVEQIVLNLAINARDAMPDGGELLIETSDVVLDEDYCLAHASVTPGPHVMLAVSDTGCGMSPELREKIFEPFFTTKQPGQGTGLGLATVFGIVEQGGGRVEVYSELGQGSSFKVYFPRVSDPVQEITRARAPEIVGGTETVLVVEDDVSVRRLATKALTRSGYNTLTAGSGREALELVEHYEGAIDLLLTDVVMPRMNGRELATKIEKMCPGIKVMFTSGYTQNVIAHHGVLDAGIQFVAKPYSLATLSTRVREVLDGE